MTIAALPRLVSSGYELETGPDQFGFLRDSSDVLGDVDALRARMAKEGYLFLRKFLDRDDVLAARRVVLERLASFGHLDPTTDPAEAIPATGYDKKFNADLARKNAALEKVLYTGPMMAFFRAFFGEDVRHFDYTWFRAIAPGAGTPSHCDVVYMGRGTSRLYTAWTPIGDIPLDMGGLMVLEGSNNHQRLRDTYCKTDVDSFCANREGKAGRDAWERGSGGVLSRNPVRVRQSLGGRWLTSDYRAGDVLIFSTYTVHASIDNGSDRIRLSSDSRYQPAADVADERWVGEQPIGHSQAGKRGRIC